MTTQRFLESTGAFLWSYPVMGLICGVGFWLSGATRLAQLRLLPAALRHLIRGGGSEVSSARAPGMSPWQVLMTSLAASIGTGSIVGVATALQLGGAGALFWMVAISFLGMVIRFFETYLSHQTRQVGEDGTPRGGPMHYLEVLTGSRYLSIVYAGCGAVATLGTGNMVQVHAIVNAVAGPDLSLSEGLAMGGILVALCAPAVLGGASAVGRAATVLVPGMALLYLGATGWALWTHRAIVLERSWQVVQAGFGWGPLAGGLVGIGLQTTIELGVCRGVFSNEAGLGTAAIATGSARAGSSYELALLSMTGVLFSTVLICSLSGLVLVCSDLVTVPDLDGGAMAIAAYATAVPWGGEIVRICVICFALSTVLGWALYGEACVTYLWGQAAITPYRWFYLAAIFPASVLDLRTIWAMADIANALMALPNLLGLALVAAGLTSGWPWLRDRVARIAPVELGRRQKRTQPR